MISITRHPTEAFNPETDEKLRQSDMHSVCKCLSRYQAYAKHRILELIDIETREKEMHAAMIIQVDAITTYKPVLHPSMVRFNEELYNDYQSEIKLA
jgi:hypothetical protein